MAANVLFIGAGAVGIAYSYALSKALPHENITVVCRSNYNSAQSHGFTVNSTTWTGGEDKTFKPRVASSVDDAVKQSTSPFDYIILSTKAIPCTPPMPEVIKPAVSPGTAIVLFQNGIGIEEPYATAFPSNPLFSTVVYVDAMLLDSASAKQTNAESLHIGAYPASLAKKHAATAETLRGLFTKAGGTIRVHDDIQGERWSKLLMNASWNPICGLTRCRDATFLASSDRAVGLVRGIMQEVAATAQACGYGDINDQVIDKKIEDAEARPLPGVKFSMLADALSSKAMEVEVIISNLIDIAAKKGVKTPILDVVSVLLTALDYGFSHKAPGDE